MQENRLLTCKRRGRNTRTNTRTESEEMWSADAMIMMRKDLTMEPILASLSGGNLNGPDTDSI